MKLCSATSCRSTVSKGQLFCGDHWAQVPERTRKAIHGAWRARDMRAYAEAFDAARNYLDLAEGAFKDVMAPPPPRWIVPQHLGAAR